MFHVGVESSRNHVNELQIIQLFIVLLGNALLFLRYLPLNKFTMCSITHRRTPK